MSTKYSLILALVFSSFMLTGCITTPTESVHVKDDRPYIMFANPSPADTIILDGVNLGLASDYLNGKTGMRIEPGKHRLQVVREGNTVLSQTFYLSSGVNKIFHIGGAQ